MDAPLTPTPSAAPVPTPDAPASPPPARTPSGVHLGRWPFGIIAVALLRLVNAVALIAVGLQVQGLPIGGVPLIAGDGVITRAIDLTLGIAVLVGVAGLLMFKRWGWILTMILVGLSLAGDLIRIYIGQPDYLALLLHVLAAFYLNGRSVRALAGESLQDERTYQP